MVEQALSPKNRAQYTEPTSLPIRELAISGHIPESFTEIVADHDGSVSAIACRFERAMKLEPIDVTTITVDDLDRQRQSRREAMLSALRDLYKVANDAIPLCERVAADWKETFDELTAARPKVEVKNRKVLRKIYPDEPEQSFRGKVCTCPEVAKNRTDSDQAMTR